jgi:hypothetical protein
VPEVAEVAVAEAEEVLVAAAQEKVVPLHLRPHTPAVQKAVQVALQAPPNKSFIVRPVLTQLFSLNILQTINKVTPTINRSKWVLNKDKAVE